MEKPGALPLHANKLFQSLPQFEPQALSDAQSARGVVEAFEGLEAAARRLAEAMGNETTWGLPG
ncbi:hypothetical protein AS156_01005 [Bradyrhizobium macuxiense]|uniref:Uncharacterized protein n=1 Tax=Bradyrhizobium macuxiense TaxID=1755647 RepID=A0A109JSI9_9BRAD|nr:hypothetical protein AS156_01005 [Bradyrhizobium macuxiense]